MNRRDFLVTVLGLAVGIVAAPKVKPKVAKFTEPTPPPIPNLDITALQWESGGGMQLNFKIMAIMVPMIKPTHGILQGVCHG